MIDYVTTLLALKTDRRGVTALEYGIIAGVLGIALVGIFGAFHSSLSSLFGTVETSM